MLYFAFCIIALFTMPLFCYKIPVVNAVLTLNIYVKALESAVEKQCKYDTKT